MRFLLQFLTAALVVGCQGPAIGWSGLTEDPEPSPDPELRAYKETHYRALGRTLGAEVPRAALVGELDRADLLFLGDHHLDERLHAEQLALLEELHRRGRPLTIGLEAIGIEDEPAVRAFLAGEIDMDALRASTRQRWPESWLDSPDVDASHYRTLMEFARESGSPVFAIEPVPRVTLARRDALIAARVSAMLADDRLVVVQVGHTHLLGPRHVVDLVRGEPRGSERAVVVGGRLSRTLRAGAPGRRTGYVQSDSGVWFPPQAR